LTAKIGGVRHTVSVKVTGLAGFLLANTRSRIPGANFAAPSAQGPQAYVAQTTLDHPEFDPTMLAADAVVGVEEFRRKLLT
jgi:hypothetical protein